MTFVDTRLAVPRKWRSESDKFLRRIHQCEDFLAKTESLTLAIFLNYPLRSRDLDHYLLAVRLPILKELYIGGLRDVAQYALMRFLGSHASTLQSVSIIRSRLWREPKSDFAPTARHAAVLMWQPILAAIRAMKLRYVHLDELVISQRYPVAGRSNMTWGHPLAFCNLEGCKEELRCWNNCANPASCKAMRCKKELGCTVECTIPVPTPTQVYDGVNRGFRIKRRTECVMLLLDSG
jgi:hypothetical protein